MPRTTLKRVLDTLGLLGAAYWLSEQLRVIRLARRPPSDLGTLDDGLPIPPARLLVAIGGATTAAAYLHGGERIAGVITQLLRKHDVQLETLLAILDFGCGSGRIIRRFKHLAPRVSLHGCDYNPALVEWCERNLPFGRFQTNSLAPPLPHASSQFDLVYAFSVFTHLTEPLQVEWLQEFRRVTRPGGHVLITVHSEKSISELTTQEVEKFSAGQLVVRYESVVGSNLCAAFHPISYIKRTLARGWELVDTVDSDVGQRFVLLRRPID